MNSGVFKLARLSWRYLWSRPLAAVLNLLVLTLGLAAITLVLLVATQLDKAFERDLAGIDLVVGAKGSPLQLILAGVFHIDVPAGNIPLQLVKANPAMGTGMVSGTTYIQRVATMGGVAPAAACGATNMGTKQIVKYQADYIFWRAA